MHDKYYMKRGIYQSKKVFSFYTENYFEQYMNFGVTYIHKNIHIYVYNTFIYS